ncbi:MAG TPA: PA2778 family cysteine peptidase [Pseudomonas sp.]|nr:PA2778 family cysteine peptidase [Pseudomonas sp.]
MRALIRPLLLLMLALLGACARSPVLAPDNARLPERVELTSVPFFPQREYQCGPAALATLLAHGGRQVTPEQLVERVYLPGRQGSLQVELVAAARQEGRLVYPLEPRLDSLLTELAAGNPVLVLQNLGFSWWPVWHFAVAVGYDRPREVVILRSGVTRRLETDFATFMRTWQRGERWAVLVSDPRQLPATASLLPWLRAASDLEETGQGEAAEQAYRAATRRWPDEALPWFALGNRLHAQGRAEAVAALRRSVTLAPDFAPGWFNLSQVLAGQGCVAQAQAARRCAAALAPEDGRFRAPLQIAGNPDRCEALPIPCATAGASAR